MGSCYCAEAECPISTPAPKLKRSKRKKRKDQRRAEDAWETAQNGWNGKAWETAWPRRNRPGGGGGGGVTLECYVEAVEGSDLGSDGGDSVGRTKSLTDDDLEELKGCLDLGFGFSYDEIPELCHTLPALELCYSMSRSLDAGGGNSAAETCAAAFAAPPVANWKISSPGKMKALIKTPLLGMNILVLFVKKLIAISQLGER